VERNIVRTRRERGVCRERKREMVAVRVKEGGDEEKGALGEWKRRRF